MPPNWLGNRNLKFPFFVLWFLTGKQILHCMYICYVRKKRCFLIQLQTFSEIWFIQLILGNVQWEQGFFWLLSRFPSEFYLEKTGLEPGTFWMWCLENVHFPRFGWDFLMVSLWFVIQCPSALDKPSSRRKRAYLTKGLVITKPPLLLHPGVIITGCLAGYIAGWMTACTPDIDCAIYATRHSWLIHLGLGELQTFIPDQSQFTSAYF